MLLLVHTRPDPSHRLVELATLVPGGPRARRITAALGGLAALGTTVLAILARRRRRG